MNSFFPVKLWNLHLRHFSANDKPNSFYLFLFDSLPLTYVVGRWCFQSCLSVCLFTGRRWGSTYNIICIMGSATLDDYYHMNLFKLVELGAFTYICVVLITFACNYILNSFQDLVTPASHSFIPAGIDIPSITTTLIAQFCSSHLHLALHHGPESAGFNTEQDPKLLLDLHSLCSVNSNFLSIPQLSICLMLMVMYTLSLPSWIQSDLTVNVSIQSGDVGEGIIMQDDELPSTNWLTLVSIQLAEIDQLH